MQDPSRYTTRLIQRCYYANYGVLLRPSTGPHATILSAGGQDVQPDIEPAFDMQQHGRSFRDAPRLPVLGVLASLCLVPSLKYYGRPRSFIIEP